MAWDDEAWADYEAQLRTQTPCYAWPRKGPAGFHLPRKQVVRPALQHLPRRGLFSQEQTVQLWDQLPKRWPDFAARTYIASQGKYLPFRAWDYQLSLVRTIRGHQNTYVLKSRQTGVSETVISYMLQQAIQRPAWVGIIFSKTGEDASELAARIKGQAASLGAYCPPSRRTPPANWSFRAAAASTSSPPPNGPPGASHRPPSCCLTRVPSSKSWGASRPAPCPPSACWAPAPAPCG